MTDRQPMVCIIMGSNSDLPVMQEAAKVLKSFDIPYEITVASAHRTPAKVQRIVSSAHDRGIHAIIAGAGWAAHLAGVIAAHTTLPVIGVPIDSSPLKGLDALLSTVQMPGGVPVASMAIGRAGAKNAAVFATQILALKFPRLQEKLSAYKSEMAEKIETQAQDIEKI